MRYSRTLGAAVAALFVSTQLVFADGMTFPGGGGSSSGITSGTTTVTGGADTQVCYNDAGVIACGDAGLTYNDATDTLTATAFTGTASVAATGDSATSFFGSGTIEDARLPATLDGKNLTTSTATTPSAADNDTSIATTAFVQGELAGVGATVWSESQKGKAADPCGSEAAEQFTRNQHPLIRFEDGTATTKQCACWEFVLSDDYAGGGITVEHWFTATATSGTMDVEAAFERQNTDLDSDSFATAVNQQWTPNATSGIPDVESIAFTDGAQIDSAAAGDRIRYQTCRDADDATNDTMVGYGEILQVRWSETP